MIYEFPDLDTLRLAITSSVVPPEVSLAPAVGGIDERGRVWLQPTAPLPRKAQATLRKWGVQCFDNHGDLKALEVFCWLQMLPVERDRQPLRLSPQTPVLFELDDPGQLPALVGEMLRLGNDRQSFRWIRDLGHDHVLLRVIGPPYYSLLRAVDGDGDPSAPRAYVEHNPGVWIEAGYEHSLARYIKPVSGQIVLLRPIRTWVPLADAPFRDIYEILDFVLPDLPVSWTDREPAARIQVPLRLTASSSTEPAELWVVRDRAFEVVDELVRGASDQLLERLMFAVGEHDGQKSIVLRVRPSKRPPPAIELAGAVGFRPYPLMPNLFLPVGQGLKPPLRRDAVRSLLADDLDRFVWLYPQADGSFTPESLPENAFLPLAGWVDYVIDREQAALEAWIESSRFDFEAYVCKDDLDRGPKPARARPAPPPERRSMLSEPFAAKEEPPEAASAPPSPSSMDLPSAAAPLPPSELEQRLNVLIARFVEQEGTLDSPERKALWPEMASLNSALHHVDEAAICWLNALWDQETLPASWLEQWARSERRFNQEQLAGADLDGILALPEPLPADLRALVAMILLAAGGDGWPENPTAAAHQAVVDRLPRLLAFLEKWEHKLGVRAVWLAATTLGRLSAGDLLTVARTRDRLLDRLLRHGMSTEYDLPNFLRHSSQQTSERFRAVRDRVVALGDLAGRWIRECHNHLPANAILTNPPVDATLAYKDLMFAFGMARLGESTRARQLVQSAGTVLASTDEAHHFLLAAFQYRIDQALQGKPHAGPLPAPLLDQLREMKELMNRLPASHPHRRHPYLVDRLRQFSLILEPQEKIDAYRPWKGGSDELARSLASLQAIDDRSRLEEAIRRLRGEVAKPWDVLRLLGTALELAPRLTEPFTIDLLQQLIGLRDVIVTTEKQQDIEQRAKLLEHALFLAGHYDRAEHVQQLVRCFLHLLETQRGQSAAQTLDKVAGQCLRGLRKLGLRQEIERLLERMTDLIGEGETLDELRARQGTRWHDSLRTLLQIAAGWFYFGRNDRALPIVDAARQMLLDPASKLTVVYQVKLACAYAGTLSQSPVELALDRFEELFRRLPWLNDTFTTGSHYSLSQLQVVEAVVLAVVSDDFAVGQNVRRWLDEDEYLVRRRIHQDMRRLMSQAGW